MRKGPDGRVYDGATFEWVEPEEYARRQAHREEMEFRRRPRQGQLCAPMVISDSLGVHGVQSMVDGRHYDSKAQMREHYRRSGVVEVGNDSSLADGRRKPEKSYMEKEAHRKKVREAVGKAFAQVSERTPGGWSL